MKRECIRNGYIDMILDGGKACTRDVFGVGNASLGRRGQDARTASRRRRRSSPPRAKDSDLS